MTQIQEIGFPIITNRPGAPCPQPRCAMIEPDPESWTIERIMAILICMVAIEPFVVAVEWLYMSIFNAPVVRTRSAAQLTLAADQQRHVWKALARELKAHGGAMHDEEPHGADEELGAWIEGSATATKQGLASQPRKHDDVRFVVTPCVSQGASLGITVVSAAHGHTKVRGEAILMLKACQMKGATSSARLKRLPPLFTTTAQIEPLRNCCHRA